MWVQRLRKSIELNPGQPQFFQLSTLGIDESPRCRTVVCRRVESPFGDGKDSQLLICTSTESEKWAELRKDPRFEICWYFPVSREQFRLKGSYVRFLFKEKDEQARLIWEEMSPTAKEMFLKASDQQSQAREPVTFGVLAFHPSSVQLLELQSGEMTNWN